MVKLVSGITARVNRDDSQTRKDIECRQIDRALARLEEAVSLCRGKDVRYGLGLSWLFSFETLLDGAP